MLSEEINFGNVPLVNEDRKQQEMPGTSNNASASQQPTFPNGKTTLKFDEFINIVKESCMDRD